MSPPETVIQQTGEGAQESASLQAPKVGGVIQATFGEILTSAALHQNRMPITKPVLGFLMPGRWAVSRAFGPSLLPGHKSTMALGKAHSSICTHAPLSGSVCFHFPVFLSLPHTSMWPMHYFFSPGSF